MDQAQPGSSSGLATWAFGPMQRQETVLFTVKSVEAASGEPKTLLQTQTFNTETRRSK